jgi:hypothetical protein
MGIGAAYVYDWLRQRQKQTEENRKKRRELKKTTLATIGLTQTLRKGSCAKQSMKQ